MNIYNYITKRRHYLISQISELKHITAALPEGILRSYNCNGRIETYRLFPATHKPKEYISRQKRALAEQVATNMYYKALLKDCKNELDIVNSCLDLYSSLDPKACEVLSELHSNNLLKTTVQEENISMTESEPSDWKNVPYNTNPNYPENLKYITIDGRKVRSKAEQEIGTLLTYNHIHYRYEPEIQIDGKTFYPDFMPRHSKTGKIFIWEHLGLVSDPEYYNKVLDKLYWYNRAGYTFGINLILTTDDKSMPLDAMTINSTIKKWLLD